MTYILRFMIYAGSMPAVQQAMQDLSLLLNQLCRSYLYGGVVQDLSNDYLLRRICAYLCLSVPKTFSGSIYYLTSYAGHYAESVSEAYLYLSVPKTFSGSIYYLTSYAGHYAESVSEDWFLFSTYAASIYLHYVTPRLKTNLAGYYPLFLIFFIRSPSLTLELCRI
jgi:hypothetical protein